MTRNGELQIMLQIIPNTNRPYRLVETYISTDGPRTRVCSGSWETQEEVEKELEKREEKQREERAFDGE